jgi:UrcA family protein
MREASPAPPYPGSSGAGPDPFHPSGKALRRHLERRKTIMFTRTLSALAALALTAGTLALSTPIHAAPADEQVNVRIGDLDLSSAAGAAALDRRVRVAARQICGWVPATNLNLQRQVSDCQDSVVAGARGEIEIALASARPRQRIALNSR